MAPLGTRSGARRVEAVLTDPGQVEHEGLLELELHLVGDLLEHRVAMSRGRGAAEVVVPVGRPLDLHVLARDQRLRARDRGVLLSRRVGEGRVVVGPRLVVLTDRRELRVREDRQQLPEPATRLEREPAPLVQLPAALPLLLVLVGAGIAQPGPGLDVVEPDVLGAGPVGPRLLAGDRAGVAPDALVEVHDHRHLRHDPHQYVTSWLRLRMMVTSSRWLPVGPR